MKFAVLGAGAVGCYVGAMLARGGHEVTLIGRPRLVEAVTEGGLVLETKQGTHPVPVLATANPEAVAGADVVLFCVKSADTVSAGNDIAPFLLPDTSVLCLQNGIDNAERLAPVLGIEPVAAAVHVAAEVPAPGLVRHLGGGTLVIGTGPRSVAIADSMTRAGIPTEVSAGVIDMLWHKLVLNCAYNALSAIAQLPCGRIRTTPEAAALMDLVVDECVAVANSHGIKLADDIHRHVEDVAVRMPDQFSSTAQDLARNRTTEIDYLNGVIVRKAKENGIAAPANLSLVASIKLIEAKAAMQNQSLRGA